MNNLRFSLTAISIIFLLFLLSMAYHYPIQFGQNGLLFTDYGKFYQSAHFIAEGKDAYTPIFFHEKSKENGKQRIIKKKLSDNLNPPFFNLTILPLGYLSYANSFLVWSVLSIVSGLLSVFLLLKNILDNEAFNPSKFIIVTIAFFTYYPTFATLQFGQVTLILLPLLVGAWSALQHGRSLLAAIFLALATSLKPFFGLFLVYFLVRREWRPLLLFCITSLILSFLLPLMVFGKQTFLNYLGVLNHIKWLASNWNVSVLGVLTRLFGGQELNMALIPIAGLTKKLYVVCNVLFLLLLTKFLWPKTDIAATEKIALDFSTILIVILLISPLAWIYYFPFLMIPFATLWKIINKYDCPSVFPACIALLILLSGLPENILSSTAIKFENMVPVFFWSCTYTIALLLLLSVCFFLGKILPQATPQTHVTVLPKYLLILLFSVALLPSFLGMMKIAYHIKMHGPELLQSNASNYFISQTV